MEMASMVPNINIDNVSVTLSQFQQNITNYAIYLNTTIPPEVAKDLERIRAWVDEQKLSSEKARQSKAISDVGKVLETAMSSVQALRSGQPAEVMKACLNIAATIATVAGGQYSGIAVALCGILGKMLSLSTPNEPDLATVFIETVNSELQKFNQRLQRQKFHGLADRVKSMISNLRILPSATEDVDLPDKALLETDFPQFIGEVSENFVRGLSAGSKEEDINDCLTSMVVYCNAQMLLFVLLADVLATFRVTGRQTIFIENLLDNQKAAAFQKLGFLSDETSVLTLQEGNNVLIYHLRRKPPVYEVVKKFRESLGMPKIPELDTSVLSMPKSISYLYPQPQTRGDNHYFQLINHTDVPIKVIAGDRPNGLKFRQDVLPRSSYEHGIAASKNFSQCLFSFGGFFVVYLDGRMRSSGNMFKDQQSLKVFKFALSRDQHGFELIALLKNTNNLVSVTGLDCCNEMHPFRSKPIFFDYNKKDFVAYGCCSGHREPEVPVGKNKCRAWRFVVQEYDPLEIDHETTETTKCSIL